VGEEEAPFEVAVASAVRVGQENAVGVPEQEDDAQQDELLRRRLSEHGHGSTLLCLLAAGMIERE
jgi:hypothetical protein